MRPNYTPKPKMPMPRYQTHKHGSIPPPHNTSTDCGHNEVPIYVDEVSANLRPPCRRHPRKTAAENIRVCVYCCPYCCILDKMDDVDEEKETYEEFVESAGRMGIF